VPSVADGPVTLTATLRASRETVNVSQQLSVTLR
jgi:hypothetical protein